MINLRWRSRLFLIVGAALVIAVGAVFIQTPRHLATAPGATVRTSDLGLSLPPLGALTIASMSHHLDRASPLVTQGGSLSTHGSYTTYVASYTSEGVPVDTLVAAPTAPPPNGGYPAIIVAHGFTQPSVYRSTGPEYRDVMELLAAHGYFVIKPDYRGYGLSGGQPTSGFYTDNAVYDLLNLVATLRTIPSINPHRIGLFSHSMGAEIGLRMLESRPGVIHAAILAAGATTTPEKLYALRVPANTSRQISPLPREELVAKYGPPSNDTPFWHQTAALNYLSEIDTNLMIAACVDDTVIPVSYSDELYHGLKASHRTVVYERYASGGHTFNGATHQKLLDATLGFFDANLVTAAAHTQAD